MKMSFGFFYVRHNMSFIISHIVAVIYESSRLFIKKCVKIPKGKSESKTNTVHKHYTRNLKLTNTNPTEYRERLRLGL